MWSVKVWMHFSFDISHNLTVLSPEVVPIRLPGGVIVFWGACFLEMLFFVCCSCCFLFVGDVVCWKNFFSNVGKMVLK